MWALWETISFAIIKYKKVKKDNPSECDNCVGTKNFIFDIFRQLKTQSANH